MNEEEAESCTISMMCTYLVLVGCTLPMLYRCAYTTLILLLRVPLSVKDEHDRKKNSLRPTGDYIIVFTIAYVCQKFGILC